MEVEDDVDEVPRQVLITAAIVFDNFALLLHLFTFNDDDDPGPLLLDLWSYPVRTRHASLYLSRVTIVYISMTPLPSLLSCHPFPDTEV